jgi:hypothetical protein
MPTADTLHQLDARQLVTSCQELIREIKSELIPLVAITLSSANANVEVYTADNSLQSGEVTVAVPREELMKAYQSLVYIADHISIWALQRATQFNPAATFEQEDKILSHNQQLEQIFSAGLLAIADTPEFSGD